MKKIITVLMLSMTLKAGFAQKGIFSKDSEGRSADHFMLQFSNDMWLNTPDSLSDRFRPTSRGFNFQVMLDKSFKSNPKFSVAFGIGISTSNAFFENTRIAIEGTAPKLLFERLDTVNRFKKYKLATTFAEIPLEFRYFSRPKTPNKSFKIAVGAKIGLLVNAHTKGKILQNRNGNQLNDNIIKVNDKSYFNTTRISATARVGYGNFSTFSSYALSTLFKTSVAADIRPLQIGISLGGL
jgi:hypothetical protein